MGWAVGMNKCKLILLLLLMHSTKYVRESRVPLDSEYWVCCAECLLCIGLSMCGIFEVCWIDVSAKKL